METASLHWGDESQFNVFPKLKPSQSNVNGAEVQWGHSLPEKPSPSSQTVCNLHDGLDPVSTGLDPTKKLSLSWKRPYVVGAGLQNMGNTCYVNAALQCLTYTPPLASYMLSQQHSKTCQNQRFCTLCAMQAHITRALYQPGGVLQPLPELVTGFHRHQQEDAHEFLMFTMDAMQQACLREYKHVDHHSDDDTLIRQIFGGYWRSQIQCLHCHGVSNTFDPYLDITLDIKAAKSVNQALAQLVKPEKLDGENSYYCSLCLKKGPASKTLTLHTSSKVLILVLKRFSNFTGSKMPKEVQYPEYLDMHQYTSQQNAGPLIYILYAVLVHAGWSGHNGHYFCYIKAGNGQWYKMDDAKITACDITSALNQQAYVLFYIQKSELERGSGSVSIGGEQRCVMSDHMGMVAAQWEPERDSSITIPESEEHTEDTSIKQVTLDQWRFQQVHNLPKPEFNLRKIDPALPAHAIVIHQSKYRDGMKKNDPEQENYPLNKSAREISAQGLMNVGKVPCLGGRARATKRRNKKGQRSLDVFQSSHYRL
ncbi:PREDICTED: ubiquitin carboxyl-terminal hydrolase 17-like protein 6 [Ceratotherium simum simum]|uniref:Ubiquitin carboxyl-terminal hydrolase n=1 Tax=Ceratotherium simum simum TaxID=73337 RepID=A0ABM0I5B2_CERSS|nr:PREDICTED: ubiquitin carboxyl-terminal hydrolase 17-like protein 6 [Ceratotherium simum simum]